MDFTLDIYRKLIESALLQKYSFFTFEEFCEHKAEGKYIILRHDVDLKAENSLATAKIEFELGVKASYFFRIVPQSNKPKIIRAIADLGHEIAYHYEDLSLFKGNQSRAIAHFEEQLSYFRQFYPVKTICMHGSPTSKYDNRDIWKMYNYEDFGIIGEPYFDFLNRKDVLYFTDTGRCWDGDKYNIRDKRLDNSNVSQPQIHTTTQLIYWFKNSGNNYPVMITTHPQRWTNNRLRWLQELITQKLKNNIKRFIAK